MTSLAKNRQLRDLNYAAYHCLGNIDLRRLYVDILCINGVGFRFYFGYGKYVRAGIYDNDFSFCLATLAKCFGRFFERCKLKQFSVPIVIRTF